LSQHLIFAATSFSDMTFTTLNDEQERELYRLSRPYWKEALRCEEAKAFLAGSVRLGSALETLLWSMSIQRKQELAVSR
jgi:hypothetical protein